MPSLDSAMLVHLAVTYGYPAMVVFVVIASMGAPLPVSFLLLAMGALSAAQGGPNFVLLALLGILASVAGDLIDYTLGRFGGAPLLSWLSRRERLGHISLFERARERLHQRGSLMILLSRFLFTPLAMPVSILVGAARFGLLQFLFWDVLGETIYVLGYLALGRIFNAALVTEGPFETIFWMVGVVATLAPILIGPGKLHWPKWGGVSGKTALKDSASTAVPNDKDNPGGEQPQALAVPLLYDCRMATDFLQHFFSRLP